MTLKETLDQMNLTEDQIKGINQSVDALIAGKLAVREAEYKKEVGTLNTKITEFETKEKDAIIAANNSIKERIGKEVMGESYETRSKYVKFDEEFDFKDEAAIKAKFEEVNKDFGGKTPDPEHENDIFENGFREVKSETAGAKETGNENNDNESVIVSEMK